MFYTSVQMGLWLWLPLLTLFNSYTISSRCPLTLLIVQLEYWQLSTGILGLRVGRESLWVSEVTYWCTHCHYASLGGWLSSFLTFSQNLITTSSSIPRLPDFQCIEINWGAWAQPITQWETLASLFNLVKYGELCKARSHLNACMCVCDTKFSDHQIKFPLITTASQ